MESSRIDALLIDACEHVKLTALAEVLASNPDHQVASIRVEGGQSLLHVLAKANSVEVEREAQLREAQLEVFGLMVALLVCHGVNINGVDHQGRTCLHLAAKRGTGTFLGTLIKRGADPEKLSKRHANVLHFAAPNPNMSAWHTLLTALPNPHTLLYAKNKLGVSPTQLCCMHGNAVGVVQCARYFSRPLPFSFTTVSFPLAASAHISPPHQGVVVKAQVDVAPGKKSSTSPLRKKDHSPKQARQTDAHATPSPPNSSRTGSPSSTSSSNSASGASSSALSPTMPGKRKMRAFNRSTHHREVPAPAEFFMSTALKKKTSKELLEVLLEGRTREEVQEIVNSVSSVQNGLRGGSWLHFCCKYGTEEGVLALLHFGACSFHDRAGLLPLHYVLNRGFPLASVALASRMPASLWHSIDSKHRSLLHYLATFAVPPASHFHSSGLDTQYLHTAYAARPSWNNLWFSLSSPSLSLPPESSIPSSIPPSSSPSQVPEPLLPGQSVLSMLCADPLLSAPDILGNRPVHLLAQRDISGYALDSLCRFSRFSDIWTLDSSGCNVLHLASIHRAEKSLAVLLLHLRQGAHSSLGEASTVDPITFMSSVVNLQDNRGRTPLHYAVKAADPICIQHLLDAGANAHLLDRKRRSVISLAAKYKSLLVLVQLVDNMVCTMEQAKFELSINGFRSSIPELEAIKANVQISFIQQQNYRHAQPSTPVSPEIHRRHSSPLECSPPSLARLHTQSPPAPFVLSSSPHGDSEDRHALLQGLASRDHQNGAARGASHTSPLPCQKYPLLGRRTGSAPAEFFTLPTRFSPSPEPEIPHQEMPPRPQWEGIISSSPPSHGSVSPRSYSSQLTAASSLTSNISSPRHAAMVRFSDPGGRQTSPSRQHRPGAQSTRSTASFTREHHRSLSVSDDSVSLVKDSSLESLNSLSSSLGTSEEEEVDKPFKSFNLDLGSRSFSTRSFSYSPPRSPVAMPTSTGTPGKPGTSSPTGGLSPKMSPRSVSPRGGRTTPPGTPNTASIERMKMQRSLSPRSLPTIKEVNPDANAEGKPAEPSTPPRLNRRNRSGSNSSLAKKAMMIRSVSLSRLPTTPGEDFLEALRQDHMNYSGSVTARDSSASTLNPEHLSLLHHSRSHSDYTSNVDPVVSATKNAAKKRPKSSGKTNNEN